MSDDELDPFDQPLRHLTRMKPPWATSDYTICGRATRDVASVISWDEARALGERYGRRRCQFLFCQTCLGRQSAAEHPMVWETDPVAVVHDWTRHLWGRPVDHVKAELLAMADLIALHPEEYAALRDNRVHHPDALAERRAERRRA